jgi:hypothetical protein
MKGNLQKGLTKQESFKQKSPRGETKKGQRPLQKKGSIKTDRGTFPCA